MKSSHSIVIGLAKPSEMDDIRNVTRQSWIETYVNFSAGITLRDIEGKFAHDNTSKGKKLAEKSLKCFFSSKSQILIAKDAGTIVAYCLAVKETKYNRIQAIYILNKYQGLGVGRKFLEKSFSWFDNHKEVHVNVADYNKKAIKFYEHLGFCVANNGKIVKIHPLPSGAQIKEIELIKK